MVPGGGGSCGLNPGFFGIEPEKSELEVLDEEKSVPSHFCSGTPAKSIFEASWGFWAKGAEFSPNMGGISGNREGPETHFCMTCGGCIGTTEDPDKVFNVWNGSAMGGAETGDLDGMEGKEEVNAWEGNGESNGLEGGEGLVGAGIPGWTLAGGWPSSTPHSLVFGADGPPTISF